MPKFFVNFGSTSTLTEISLKIQNTFKIKIKKKSRLNRIPKK